MVWVWRNPPDDPVAWVDFDDKNSQVESYKLLGGSPIENASDGAVAYTRRFRIGSIMALKCLPNTNGTPLIDEELVGILKKIAGANAVQFVPVSVCARGGKTEKFSFAVPMVNKDRLDHERSIGLEWAWPEKKSMLMYFKSICFQPGCLADGHYLRDEESSRILISEELKSALEELGDMGLWFCRPDELAWMR